MNGMSAEPVDRRPFLKAVAGGTVALGAVGVGARVALHRDDPAGGPGEATGPALTLSAEAGTDVASVEVPLGDDLLPNVASRRWESARLPTNTHTMVAFTWTEVAVAPHLLVRTRLTGGRSRSGRAWTDWERVPLLRDVPDPGSGEGGLTTGTDLLWVGAADGVQVRLKGRRPTDLTMLLLHPARRRADLGAGGPSQRAAVNGRPDAVVAKPAYLDRVAWGADESWRSGTPRINSTVEQVHVHHTVTRNDYTPEDVPALIRGMYRYHTKSLGWSDIAYNFLVDRFGRIWTGRAGGAAKPVRGAHTLGFNASSCGVSVIGNLDQVAPTNETLEAVAALAAWKLDLYSRDPLGSATVLSEGSDRFRSGTTPTLPVIDGHRDTNDTSCPGGYLYAALPDIRNRAKARMTAALVASQTPVAVLTPTTVSGGAALGQTLTATTGGYDPASAAPAVTWLRDGAPVGTGSTYVVGAADVGHQLSAQVAVTAEGRSPAAENVAAGGPVTARAVVTVTTQAKAKRAIVRVKVSAPDGVTAVPEGRVVIKLDKRRRTVTLRNGRGSTRFMHVADGDHVVKAVYLGGGTLSRSSRRGSVTLG
jgi:hypothetical protein